MAPPRSRLRKQQRKKSDRTPWLLLSSVVIVFLFYLGSVAIEDSDLHIDDTGPNERDMVAQCRESCSEVILSRDEILSATSPGSLAFSAVDALFSFREGDDEDRSTTNIKRRKHDKQQTKNMGQGKNNIISSQNDAYRNLSPRPNRLPPLIETLVGTIDGNEDFKMLPQGDFTSGTRQSRSDRIHSPTGREVEIPTRAGDDSVAMVAAAAAAALWSESESRQGTLRMKAFNDEWESSLRWIASWGQQQQHGKKATIEHSSNINSSRAPQYASKGSSRKKRQKGGALGNEVRDTRHLNSDEYSGFSELLDACVAQCTGGTREAHTQDSNTRHVNVLEIESNGGRIISFSAVIFALKSISLPFVYSSGYFRSIQANVQVIKSLFGMAVSTAIILGIRNVTDSWKHKTSLRLLLEEETYQEKLDNCRHKKNKARILGKKSAPKRSRRNRKECHRVQKSHHHGCRILTVNCRGNEDVSVSSGSSNECTSFREDTQDKKLTIQNSVDDHSVVQGREDHPSTSSSSCIPYDVDPDYCLIRAGSNNSKVHTENTAPAIHVLKQRKSKRKKAHVTKSKPTSCRERSRTLAQSPLIKNTTQNAQLKNKPCLPELTRMESTMETESLMKSDQDAVSVMTPDSPNVPTEEQREKASSLLREFQLTQVQKYIKSKQAQRSGSSILLPRTTPLHGLVHATSEGWMEESAITASTNENIGGEQNLDAGTDVGQSILNMLDESDEEVERKTIWNDERTAFSPVLTNKSLLVSPVKIVRKLNVGQNQISSIALGGLLASKNTTSTSVSSNPWCTKNIELRNQSPTLSFESCSTHSQEPSENPTEYTDANVCLQVSAREFSPSWDKGYNRGSHSQVW